MELDTADRLIVAGYLGFVVFLGFLIRKRATRQRDSFYLADRNIPWWMLGLSGCSSYIDIGGTMAMVGVLFYLGLKGIWATHIVWGWFIICFYMAFQAKWIRRSGVMTFAEWNETRYGPGRDTEAARVAAAIFLLVLMVFNLTYIAVGIGKFAETHFPLERWQSTLIVFSAIGIYVTLGGFFGVIVTDMLQTVLIAVGAVLLTVFVFRETDAGSILASRPEGWTSLAATWTLWDGFHQSVPESYQHFYWFGPLLLGTSTWLIFRVLAGPNVWDFQFFLSARSPRDAALAGGVWTVGYTLRWILGCAFLLLSFSLLETKQGYDAEKIMPEVLGELPVGVKGLFLAVLLAALMSTLDAMVNVTSSVVVNDFLKRYAWRRLGEKACVRLGQAASIAALLLGFWFSLSFQDIISAWETMIFSVVTIVLVPATFRWHWWRFSAKAFVIGMAGSAAVNLILVLLPSDAPGHVVLAVNIGACFYITLAAGLFCSPPDMEVLLEFYTKIRPFGFWGPVKREARRRGLIPPKDHTELYDILNGLLTAAYQVSLALIPFYAFLRFWRDAGIWLAVSLLLTVILYFTWYRTLPPRSDGTVPGP